MRAAGEIRAGIGSLVAVQIFVALATIGLLVRMAPAIAHILEEDVSSTAAVEEMYASFALRDCGLSIPEAEARFEQAADQAYLHAAAPDEVALINSLEPAWRRAMAGDCDSRDRVAVTLDRIADLNRAQMYKADHQARQLGAAGAWAAAILGLVTFATSAVIIRQFTQRVAIPLSEIEAVLLSASQGDPYRRCRRIDGPAEYSVIAARLNQLLDRRLASHEDEDPQIRANDRALLQHLLDRIGEPCVAVDRSGAVIAANDQAMDVLAGSGIDSLADALAISPDGDPETSLITAVEPFGKAQGFLVRLQPLPPDPATEEQKRAMAENSIMSDELESGIRRTPNPSMRRGTAEAMSDGPSSAHVVPPSAPDPKGKPDWERD